MTSFFVSFYYRIEANQIIRIGREGLNKAFGHGEREVGPPSKILLLPAVRRRF
jgi:hypothetical protein